MSQILQSFENLAYDLKIPDFQIKAKQTLLKHYPLKSMLSI